VTEAGAASLPRGLRTLFDQRRMAHARSTWERWASARSPCPPTERRP